MFNITMLVPVLPLAAIASCALVLLCNRSQFRSSGILSGFIWNLIFLAAITSISVIISNLIFDNSYDGQTYHYETQAAIVRGWNPVKQELISGTTNIFFINHYAKGYESAAACFWIFFRNPESGKALNILMFAACFFYVSFLIKKLNIWKSRFGIFFTALIISLNPVAVYQLFTFYVDGQIATLITILIASLYLSLKQNSTFHLTIAAVVFCVMSDIKFTGLIYSVAIFGFFGLWMIFKKMSVSRFIFAGVAAFAIAFFLTGFNPYVTNTVHKSNPFYPLVGKNKIDIITQVQPASFAYKSAPQKFAESNLSESHNIHGHAITPEPKFKIPFTFSINEWLVFKGSECRIAGYGPTFGGILLISLVLLVASIFIKKKSIIKEDAFIISLVLLLTLVINPEMWMSRYVPQLWLFPFCVIWLFKKEYHSNILKKISSFLFVALTINTTGIAMVNWGAAALISYKMHKELEWLKTLNKPVQIVTNDFIAARERIKYSGIKFSEVNHSDSVTLSGVDKYKLQNSQAIILLPAGTPKLGNTGILKLLNKKLE